MTETELIYGTTQKIEELETLLKSGVSKVICSGSKVEIYLNDGRYLMFWSAEEINVDLIDKNT